MREWKGSGTNKIFYIENLLFLFNSLALCGANGRFESLTFLEQLIIITTKSLSLLCVESSLSSSFLQSLTLYSLSHNHINQSFCGLYDQSFIKRSFLWGGGWGSYISSQQNLPTLLSVTTRCQITPLLSSVARCYPRRLHVADLFSHVWALRTEMRYLFFLEILTSE